MDHAIVMNCCNRVFRFTISWNASSVPILFANENLLKSSASQFKKGAAGEDFKDFAGDGSGGDSGIYAIIKP